MSIVRLYDNFSDAHAAMDELLESGFASNEITVVTSEKHKPEGDNTKGQVKVLGAAGAGAAIGGAAALLAGLTAIVLPGVGPVLAVGPLLGLGGAAFGFAIGGIIGALGELGVPKEEAEFYAEGVRRGSTMIVVKRDKDSADRARALEILERHNPVNMDQRLTEWREGGWTKFDPNAAPVSQDQNYLKEAKQEAARNEESSVGVQDNPLRAGQLPGMSGFESYEDAYLRHYQENLANAGQSFDFYRTAYRYGYDLAGDERYRDADWSLVDREVGRFWEHHQPGAWVVFRDAVRFAWDKVRTQDNREKVNPQH
jgi:hypothetical protein